MTDPLEPAGLTVCPPLILAAREDGAPLAPLSPAHAELLERTGAHVATMIARGNAYQQQLNAEHRSEFNPQLLYADGVTYSQRCDAAGAPCSDGQYWRGVRGAIESSFDPHNDYFTIDFDAMGDDGGASALIVHLGRRDGARQSGILVDTRYPFNEFRLNKQIRAAYEKRRFDCEIVPGATATDSALRVWTLCASVDQALEAADRIAFEYLSRVALEGKFFNLFRQRPNMLEIHDGNLQDVIRVPGEERDRYPDKALLITSTRVCRRCRSEFQELFADFSARHPDITIGVAFTDKPKLKFIPVVFEGHCGGVRLSGLVTPFVIPYRHGAYCGRYLATGKHDPPPSVQEVEELVAQYFG